MKRSTKIITTGSDVSATTCCTVYSGLEILFGHSHYSYLVIHHLSVFFSIYSWLPERKFLQVPSYILWVHFA